MQVHRSLSQLPAFRNAVLTIGTFDGVHLGHQKIIQQLVQSAREVNGESVLISFDPHPRKIISSVPGDIRLLTLLEEKIRVLEPTGIDHLVVVPFDHHFANQTATQYIHEFIYQHFHPHTIIIGYDHRFGKGRTGDYQLLEAEGVKLGFKVQEIPEHMLQESGISSTRIRNAITEHRIADANALLGYDYFFCGTVVEGNQLGRTIGFPTANLHIKSEDKLIPGNGVYAVTVEIDAEPAILKGMMNIGYRPTVDGKRRMVEVNIFDFDRDIYGKTLRVMVHHYLRGEQKFNGLEGLKAQLAADRDQAIALLA